MIKSDPRPLRAAWVPGKSLGSIVAPAIDPEVWTERLDYGGYVVCESVASKEVALAIQSAPLAIRALARLLFDPSTVAFEEAHAVLAHALGFEGEVAYPDLDRAAHGLLEPILGGPELPRVLSTEVV